MEAARAEVLKQLAAGDFKALVLACEELELVVQEELCETPSVEQVDSLGTLYALHLLAYLVEGQLCAARFLWKRTPTVLQQHPQAAAAHGVLAARWQRQHATFFERLRAGPWDAQLQPLVDEVLSRSRGQMLDQVGDAYEAIAVERLAALLGAPAAEARAACEARGWPVDDGGKVSPAKIKPGQDLMQMGESQLEKLAEYVAYLEQPQ
mmetsp:Transcript_157630/g.483073  ORF Transcript_157630/g.483073 Transcript_157630/m.483073 type:complete len:208 (-) Transcript_157630:51-674(-)